MWLLSYFWDSEVHLEIFSLCFETLAAIIEVSIALWLVKTLLAIGAHPTEEEEQLKEKLEAAATLIAALFVFVAVASPQTLSCPQQVKLTQLKRNSCGYGLPSAVVVCPG